MINSILSSMFAFTLGLLPAIGSIMYFKHCKELHAHMLLWSAITILIVRTIGIFMFRIMCYFIDVCSSVPVILGTPVLSIVSDIAYLVFGIGFILLIKKIINNTTRQVEHTS